MGSSNSSPIFKSKLTCNSKLTSASRMEFIQKLQDFADNDPKFYLIRKGKYALYSSINPSPLMAAVQYMACHEYIIIEFGRKLNHKINGFTYAKALRLDFGKDGYSMAILASKNYWKIYGEEQDEQKGTLDKSFKCRGTIDSLLEVISVHVYKYDLATNNCKHFAEIIWEEMVMPKRESYDL
eukprot:949982_1